MKKIYAIFVAMLMVLSIIPAAFAENDVATDPQSELTSEDTNSVENETETEDTADSETEDLEDTTSEDETEVETEIEDSVTEAELNETELEEVGTTPDSPIMWGLDRAMERIDLALTFNKAAKAKKGLAHAKERLLEVKSMIAAKKLNYAAKAQAEFEEDVAEAEDNTEAIGNGDSEADLADQVEIEKEMNQNRVMAEQLNNIALKTKGLNETQRTELKAMLGNMTLVTNEFKVKLEAKKNKTMLKIKAEKGATDEEILALVSALSAGQDLDKVRIVQKGAGIVKEKGKDKSSETENETELEIETEDGKVKTKEKSKVRSGDSEEETEVEIEVETESKGKGKDQSSDEGSDDSTDDSEDESEEDSEDLPEDESATE